MEQHDKRPKYTLFITCINMIYLNGKEYRTLNQQLYYGSNRIGSAYYGSIKVYPESTEQYILFSCGQGANNQGAGSIDGDWVEWIVLISSSNVAVTSSDFNNIYQYVALIQTDGSGTYASALDSYMVDMAANSTRPIVYKCDPNTGNHTIQCSSDEAVAIKYDVRSGTEDVNSTCMHLRIKITSQSTLYRMVKPTNSNISKKSNISSIEVRTQGYIDVVMR